MRNATEQYDLIVLDLTDAGGRPPRSTRTEFYRACAARLSPTGAMTLHIASPVAHPGRVRETLAHLRGGVANRHALPHVDPALRRHVDDGLLLDDARSQAARPRPRSIAGSRSAGSPGLQYYNGDMHRAALALPNFVRALVA